MWQRTLLLLAFFTHEVLGLGLQTEIFDVTTVFEAENPDVGRVHFRTNSLGLPVHGTPQSIVSQVFHNTSQSLQDTICDSFENTCNWKMNGCSFKYESYNVVRDQLYYFNKGLKFKFISTNTEKNNYLYFTSEKDISSGYFHIGKFYIIRSECSDYYDDDCNIEENAFSFWIGCKQSEVLSHNLKILKKDGSHLYANCLTQYYDTQSRVESGEILSFNFENYIQINKSSSSSPGETMKFHNTNIKYFHSSSSLKLEQLAPVYSCNSYESEVISPELYTANGNSLTQCLGMVFNSPVEYAQPLFEILVEDSKKKRLVLLTVNNTKVGWNFVHLNLTIPESVTGAVKIIVKKTILQTISISRIFSCNPDGEEVRLLSPSHDVRLSTERFSSSLITTTAYLIEPVDEEIISNTTSCMNGGVLTDAGCACPPGFTDSKCQQGCGRNRFGQDCGGLCSPWKSECKGLVLCTNPTGCHCAPGYSGEHCRTTCSAGWYGNDCLQPCGHCLSSCDIYTGECDMCESGYLPPLCKSESAYYPLEPVSTSPEYGIIKVSFNPDKYVATSGTPELYQIQYKEESEGELSWKTYVNKNIEKHSNGSVKDVLVSENIDGLKDGVAYQVRVLFFDENWNKYDGDLVRPAQIITRCEIPKFVDLKIEVERYTDLLIFSWNTNITSEHGCPVENYEVTWKVNWQWFTNRTYTNSIILTDFLPGTKISFKVRVKTSAGFSQYSEVLSTSTIRERSSKVRNLKIDSIQSTSVQVSWNTPIENEDTLQQYYISYKCVDQPACSPGCWNISEGQITTGDTHVTLEPLVPSTQYMVTVAPQNGPLSFIYVGTSTDVPKEVPHPSTRSFVRTNTSVTVFWDEPVVCSGFLFGYNYQLVKEVESLKVLNSGFTKDTSVSFNNLTASTQYIVRVSVVTNAGWDPDNYLAINVSTSATVPEAVRNLTVYKRSKGMLGLRWAPPRAVYGQLKLFTIIYTLAEDMTVIIVEPTPCVVWSELFCYTIEGLSSNRRYNISVSARNVEVPEDGEKAFVTGVTKENSPTMPQDLKMMNSTSTSIVLQWKYPELANGIIRSFLISVEETENYDQENCCQVYPLMEVFVKEEAQKYETEISGLHPASSYYVSVSAKTVGMGPSQPLVVYTRPPHLPFNLLPKVKVLSISAEPELNWLPQETSPDVNNSEIYTPLVKAHLLLLVVNESQPITIAQDSGIVDPQLNSLLAKNIGKPFYFYAEYNEEDVVHVSGLLNVGKNSVWGQPPTPLLPFLPKYQLIAVQITEYSGAFNVDLQFSQPFTLT